MNRIIAMDAIRGFALLGLLSMNMVHMANFELGYVPAQTAHYLDPFFAMVNSIFFDGRFRTLFAMLFGAALCIQVAKTDDQSLARHRLTWLMVFGVLHGVLVWPGDILFNYALSGFVALRFIDASDKKLNRYAIGFILVPSIAISLLLLIDPEPQINRTSEVYLEFLQQIPASYLELLTLNGLYFIIISLLIPVITLWYTAGLMLLGMRLYRSGMFDLERTEPVHKINLFAVIAIILSFVGFVLERKLGVEFFEGIDWILAIPVALFYVVVIKAAMRGAKHQLWSLQCVGRLALSFYLLQSIVFVSYFYFINPNAISTWERVDYFSAFVIASIIQLALASIYFKLFKQGPFEKLLKLLVIRRARYD
ncbi:DUF418 domain-containing protein [Pseudoalteromonas piscicida]|uniref:DUF418 domain-containing protein n=1 Tax=Pseudoalteromonas piscicida TaxID=43662 RepID=UPI0032C1EB49